MITTFVTNSVIVSAGQIRRLSPPSASTEDPEDARLAANFIDTDHYEFLLSEQEAVNAIRTAV